MKYLFNLFRIIRVIKMERLLDQVQNAHNSDVSKQLKILDRYYKTKWLSDYEADEKGLLPRSLKRGVLSQDTLYNVLSEK